MRAFRLRRIAAPGWRRQSGLSAADRFLPRQISFWRSGRVNSHAAGRGRAGGRMRRALVRRGDNDCGDMPAGAKRIGQSVSCKKEDLWRQD
jgi:hypothetical protein